MRNILIKDAMTPINDYVTIRKEQTLFDVFQVLETKRDDKGLVHRDLIVVDGDGLFQGKVTMLDIFRSLEPNYKKLNVDYTDGTLTKDHVLETIKDFDLWMTPVKDLCERGSRIQVSEMMHVPESHEFVQASESLERALHEYVMGAHQPLIVKDGDTVVGVLRFEDLYDVIRRHMATCALG